jgi:hypothetical protein
MYRAASRRNVCVGSGLTSRKWILSRLHPCDPIDSHDCVHAKITAFHKPSIIDLANNYAQIAAPRHFVPPPPNPFLFGTATAPTAEAADNGGGTVTCKRRAR